MGSSNPAAFSTLYKSLVRPVLEYADPAYFTNEYVAGRRSRLCAIPKTSHLSGLKRSCHLDAQDSNLSTSNCGASLSLARFDNSLFTSVSSAKILNVEEMLDDMSLT